MARKKRKTLIWRARFLRVLERTGNVRLTAEEVGVDFTSAYALRRRDAEFAVLWTEALEGRRRRASGEAGQAGSPHGEAGLLRRSASRNDGEGGKTVRRSKAAPSNGFGWHEPAAPSADRSPTPLTSPARRSASAALATGGLLPRNDGGGGADGEGDQPLPRPGRPYSHYGEDRIVRLSRRSGAQVVRTGAGRWNERAEKAFFAALADTANVRQAAKAAGFSTTAIYNRRLALPEFRAKWEAAVETGCARVEMMLIEAATRSFDAADIETPEDAPKVSVGEAISILRLHRGAAKAGHGSNGLWGAKEPSIEEVQDEVLRRLAAIRKHRERGG